jgi:hypothetical protein
MSRRKRTNGMVLRMDGVESALYAEVEGKKVAKRFSGGRLISLEPGYVVRGAEPGNYDCITVEYHPELANQH